MGLHALFLNMPDKKIIGISQYGLSWIGRDGGVLETHQYLFLSKRGEEPFIFSQKSLHELNDFCVTLFEGMRAKSALEPSFSEVVEFADEDDYFDLIDKFQFGYAAEDLGRMFCPASALIMLYANLIRALHVIARHYGHDRYESWRTSKDNRGAELRQLVDLLEGIHGQKLDVFYLTRVQVLLDANMRTLRNDFLHGNWEGVERRLVGISLKSCFEVVSQVLYFLEEIFYEERFLSEDCTKLA